MYQSGRNRRVERGFVRRKSRQAILLRKEKKSYRGGCKWIDKADNSGTWLADAGREESWPRPSPLPSKRHR